MYRRLWQTQREKEKKSTEDFWCKAERLYYTALIGYLYYEAPEEEQNFETLLAFIDASEVREEDENFKKCSRLYLDALEKKSRIILLSSNIENINL